MKSLLQQPLLLTLSLAFSWTSVSLAQSPSSEPFRLSPKARKNYCSALLQPTASPEEIEEFKSQMSVFHLDRSEVLDQRGELKRQVLTYLASQEKMNWIKKVHLFQVFLSEMKKKGDWQWGEKRNANSFVITSPAGKYIYFSSDGRIFRAERDIIYKGNRTYAHDLDDLNYVIDFTDPHFSEVN